MTVEVEINSGCNKACSYCPNADFKRIEQGHMDESLFITLLNQLKDLNFQGSLHYHFYNEPLLSPQLESFLALSKGYLPQSKSIIFTNGSFLTLDKYEALVSSGADKFYITKHESAQDFVFDQTYLGLTDEQKKRVVYHQYTELHFTNRGGLVDKGPVLNQGASSRSCFIPATGIVITLKGNVLTCYEDFFQKNEMGNIKETHLRDIWNQENYQQFREDLKKGRRELYEVCKTCNNTKFMA